jgi:hypothetical protein
VQVGDQEQHARDEPCFPLVARAIETSRAHGCPDPTAR